MNNLDLFMEASAKTGYNALNILVEAAKIFYKDYKKKEGLCNSSTLKKYINL